MPLDAEYARKQAEHRAFDFSGVLGEEGRGEFAKTNFDEDGDEMFHDLLDVLYNVAKPEQIGRGGPPRDGFRGFAKELQIQLNGGEGELERFHYLSIPQDEFRDLVRLRLVTHFGRRPNGQIEQDGDLNRVADCIVRAFAQDPDLGIT